MTRVFILMVLLLAGCSKPIAKSGDAKVSAAEVAAEANKLKLQPGLWQTTTRLTAMNVRGLPQSAMDDALNTPTITSSCVTPAQAARPPADMLSGTIGGNCAYQRFSMANARIDAAMTCNPPGLPGGMAMTFTGTWSPAAYATDMSMRMDGPAPMTMTANVSGRRVGECDPTLTKEQP